MIGLTHFEDFAPGLSFDVGSAVANEAEMVAFARAFDPQPFHVDPEAAARSPFGGLVASGWYTAALVMRCMVEGYLLDTDGFGSPGVDALRFLHPVRPSDTISVHCTVVDRRVSSSKPDRGIVTIRATGVNQHGTTVITFDGLVLLRLRGPEPRAEESPRPPA